MTSIPDIAVLAATLKPKEERRMLRGHLWAYRNEFQHLPEASDGTLMDVFTAHRRFVGRGFYQAAGGIAVRVLSSHQEIIDEAFFAARVEQARAFRAQCFPGSRTYRWIYGESDGLPGLVADRYGALVSVQTACAFYTPWAEFLAACFLQAEGVKGVLFRGDGPPRIFGTMAETVEFELEGLDLRLDPWAAQKTGLFLDQRCNRLAMAPYAAGKRVLDGHCYHGLWSCHAARAGAEEVLGVDTSEAALSTARVNAESNSANGVCRFECAGVEEVLARGESYGLIILDPPAYAKTRAQLAKALTRYTALNKAAFESLEPGGILVTCSCSHFVDAEAFHEIIKRAASSAGRRAWLLEMRGAAPDHPILLSMPETAYLKCAILRVE